MDLESAADKLYSDCRYRSCSRKPIRTEGGSSAANGRTSTVDATTSARNYRSKGCEFCQLSRAGRSLVRFRIIPTAAITSIQTTSGPIRKRYHTPDVKNDSGTHPRIWTPINAKT